MRSRTPLSFKGIACAALLAACGHDAADESDCASFLGDAACGSPALVAPVDSGSTAPAGEAGAQNRPGDGGVADTARGSDGGGSDGGSSTTPGRTEPNFDGGSVSDAGGAANDAGRLDAQVDAQAHDGGGTPDAMIDASQPPARGTGFVGEHGPLHVRGNSVVDQADKPIQLRGMSWFWSQWTDFYVARNVDVLVDDWKGTVVRAALGVENDGGYLMSPDANVAKVRTLVDRAIERGVYVIIDWHDHHAQDHAAQATSFFQQMAKMYGKQPNVIFEIYNEPMDVSWPQVKAYAEPVIRAIRAAGSTNLVIVGTPNWSQDVDVAANDRITSDNNVAYTLHFYAATHKQALRDKAQTALNRGIALFVTEWGTCSADGNGSVNEAESRTWLDFLKNHSISWANWALNNKAEACSAIQASANATGPWAGNQLTQSGAFVKAAMP